MTTRVPTSGTALAVLASVLMVLLMPAGSNVSALSNGLSRRQSLEALVGGVATTVLAPSVIPVLSANAVVTDETPRVVTRMGGLLVGRHILSSPCIKGENIVAFFPVRLTLYVTLYLFLTPTHNFLLNVIYRSHSRTGSGVSG